MAILRNNSCMTSNTLKTRSPIRRQKARNYLLITLLSFALSVSLTRLFLTMTGYPQLGTRELHIAHVLWGGLILFIATLLPLLFTNQWIFTTTALLSGVGVGLFMDEVGKFITQTNDYFYPPAAPIIYAFFLLVVLVYVDISRKKASDARTEMYYILQDFDEVLDHDLSEEERNDILTHLDRVLNDTTHPDLANLAQALKGFIQNKDLELVPDSPSFWKRWRMRMEHFEEHWLTAQPFPGGPGWGITGMEPVFSVLSCIHPDPVTRSGRIKFDPGRPGKPAAGAQPRRGDLV